MEFDHLDPTTKAFGLDKLLRSEKKLRAEISKCRVLCSNCHRQVTYEAMQNPERRRELRNKAIAAKRIQWQDY